VWDITAVINGFREGKISLVNIREIFITKNIRMKGGDGNEFR